MTSTEFDELCINAMRFLTVDAVQKAPKRLSGNAYGCRSDGLGSLGQLYRHSGRRYRRSPLRRFGSIRRSV